MSLNKPDITTDVRLRDAVWRTAPATRAVMDALEAVRPACARFVGGCVRNTLMGRPVDDIDVATQLLPEAVIAAAKAANLTAIPTGIDHGTVTIISDHQPFEVTTLRKDVETDGRRAVVAFTEDWAEDAQRRDFRLNALYADRNGQVYDPTGGGLADAEAGRVIFIGNADERLREDYLRILRFFRFNAWYGAEMDADGLAACDRQKAGLEKIAAERIGKECLRLLAAPSPGLALEAMQSSGVLAQIVPELVRLDRIAGLERVERLTGRDPDPLVRLICLLDAPAPDGESLPETIRTIARRLKLSNRERDRLLAFAGLKAPFTTIPPEMSEADLNRLLYWAGPSVVMDQLFHSWAGNGKAGSDEAYLRLLTRIDTWERPVFPLGGGDALELGLRGAAVGRALAAAEMAWVSSGFDMSIERLKQIIAEAGHSVG